MSPLNPRIKGALGLLEGFTWLVGLLQLGHLRGDEFSALLLGTVTVHLLGCCQLLQLLEVILRQGEEMLSAFSQKTIGNLPVLSSIIFSTSSFKPQRSPYSSPIPQDDRV